MSLAATGFPQADVNRVRLPATLCDVLQRYQRDPQALEAVVVAEDERVLEAKLLRQIARAFRVDCHPLFIRMGIHAAANEVRIRSSRSSSGWAMSVKPTRCETVACWLQGMACALPQAGTARSTSGVFLPS